MIALEAQAEHWQRQHQRCIAEHRLQLQRAEIKSAKHRQTLRNTLNVVRQQREHLISTAEQSAAKLEVLQARYGVTDMSEALQDDDMPTGPAADKMRQDGYS